MNIKRKVQKNTKGIVTFLFIFIIVETIILTGIKSQNLNAQYWAALPPYNTLWPLWSSALSPTDTTTGLPTPLVTSLYPDTVLPVQPALTWHPVLRNPWLLYNTPLGLAYYDPIGGIDLWPPAILTNQITGLPINITLPANYSALPPTSVWWILQYVPPANWSYLVAYPSYSLGSPTPPLNALLTGYNLL